MRVIKATRRDSGVVDVQFVVENRDGEPLKAEKADRIFARLSRDELEESLAPLKLNEEPEPYSLWQVRLLVWPRQSASLSVADQIFSERRAADKTARS